MDPEEVAAIEVEPFADHPKRVTNRIVHAIRRQVDELDRQVADEPFERDLLLDQQSVGLFDLLPRGDVHDRDEYEEPVLILKRVQRNFDGKLFAVATTPDQSARGPRRSHLRSRQGFGVVGLERQAQTLGQEHLDGPTDELRPRVTKLPFELAVDDGDRTVGSDHQHSARQRFDCQPGQGIEFGVPWVEGGKGGPLVHF